MDELVVRVCRALANLPRLHLLAHMARVGETPPTQLARELDMPLDMVSAHLRVLTAAGLIWRRRSGVWCYYSAQSPYSERALSGRVMVWLGRLFSRAAKSAPGEKSKCSPGSEAKSEAAHVCHAVYDAATAFTKVRRLQILRRLASGDAVDVPTLTNDLSMSKAAVSRHVAKLIRRGYVAVRPAGRRSYYQLPSRFKSPIHAKLFAIVSQEWQ